MATNDTKMDWNCDSDEDKSKYNGKIPDRGMASSSIREMKGFEIQTSDIRSPPKRAS